MISKLLLVIIHGCFHPQSFQFVCCYYHSKISVGQSSNLAILDNEGGGRILGGGGKGEIKLNSELHVVIKPLLTCLFEEFKGIEVLVFFQ